MPKKAKSEIKKMKPAELVELPVDVRPKIRLPFPVELETENANGKKYKIMIPRNQPFEVVDDMISGAEVNVIRNKIFKGALERLLSIKLPGGVRLGDVIIIEDKNNLGEQIEVK